MRGRDLFAVAKPCSSRGRAPGAAAARRRAPALDVTRLVPTQLGIAIRYAVVRRLASSCGDCRRHPRRRVPLPARARRARRQRLGAPDVLPRRDRRAHDRQRRLDRARREHSHHGARLRPARRHDPRRSREARRGDDRRRRVDRGRRAHPRRRPHRRPRGGRRGRGRDARRAGAADRRRRAGARPAAPCRSCDGRARVEAADRLRPPLPPRRRRGGRRRRRATATRSSPSAICASSTT